MRSLLRERDTARVQGTAGIDRTLWGVGGGEWAKGDRVSKTVTVVIDLVALRGEPPSSLSHRERVGVKGYNYEDHRQRPNP